MKMHPQAAASLRRPVVAGLLLAAGVVLAGCQTNPLQVTRTSCPAVGIIKHTGTLTRFQPGAPLDADRILFNASIGAVSSTCTEGSTITSQVTYRIIASRPGRAGALSVAVPLFTVVMKDGTTMLAKEITTAMIAFPDGVDRVEVSQAATATTPRLPPPPKPDKDNPDAPPPRGTYEVLVGFQLTDAEAAYNAAK